MYPLAKRVIQHPAAAGAKHNTWYYQQCCLSRRGLSLNDAYRCRHVATAAAACDHQETTAASACSRSHFLRSISAAAAALGVVSFAGPSAAASNSLPVARSVEYSQPATLTVRNDGKHPLKVYWINYDGDQELFAYVEPSTSWTVDTFSTHPWRIVDEETGMLLKEVVAVPGDQTIKMTGEEKPLRQRAGEAEFRGFDGIGGQQADYSEAEVATLFVSYEGGAVGLKVEGAKYPVEIPLPSSQMVGLVESAAGELRRPSSVVSWQRTLQAAGAEVERVMVTRVVPPYFYTRVVLKLPGGKSASIDTQPGDSIALAQQTGCPVYVANDIVSVVNDFMEQRAALSADVLGGLVPGGPTRRLPDLPKAPTTPPPLPGIPAPPPGKPLPPVKGYNGTPFAVVWGGVQADGVSKLVHM